MKLLVLAIALLAPSVVVADEVPAPKLELVSAGKGAKKELRFTPAKGSKRTIVMTSQQAVARGLQGKLPAPEAAPAVRSTIEVEILDVDPNGDIRYQFTYRKAEVLEDKRANPEIAKQMAAAVAGFNGLKGTGVISNRGVTKSVNFEAPATASREARTAIETARSVATQIAQPLPEQAVGVGAKWKTTATASAGEITAQTTATYELVERADNRAKVRVTMTVTGKGSGTGNLTTDTTGRGETSIDLASMIPTQSKIDLRTEVGLDVDGKRLAQLVTTKTTISGQ